MCTGAACRTAGRWQTGWCSVPFVKPPASTAVTSSWHPLHRWWRIHSSFSIVWTFQSWRYTAWVSAAVSPVFVNECHDDSEVDDGSKTLTVHWQSLATKWQIVHDTHKILTRNITCLLMQRVSNKTQLRNEIVFKTHNSRLQDQCKKSISSTVVHVD